MSVVPEKPVEGNLHVECEIRRKKMYKKICEFYLPLNLYDERSGRNAIDCSVYRTEEKGDFELLKKDVCPKDIKPFFYKDDCWIDNYGNNIYIVYLDENRSGRFPCYVIESLTYFKIKLEKRFKDVRDIVEAWEYALKTIAYSKVKE